ncbi:MAG: 3'-5' exoribonuclease YhaM [Candidatus Moanabacter tarae]|uniref:3'-5' exoribonuclease YhaM n=1 Tax=Candidatus Moanibacter tarae TaxID=2200854 RepID=A0A2Z4ADH5_9BACT|nr:MAG: 3'-5' exoribonuclease YhaM [Candidatus Moanabacter tarae]|tara:strand:- start:15363 stop:16352 length:990 start_codon:yes stop_codon:yes gene_type:complete
MKSPTIAELQSSDRSESVTFEAIFLFRKSAVKRARNGNEFLTVELGDCTGNFQFVCFNDNPTRSFFGNTEPGTPVKVSGHTDFYEERFSPRIHTAHSISEEELSDSSLMERLVASSVENSIDLWNELIDYTNQIREDRLRKTVHKVLSETEIELKFIPAAISMHHAYRSGLLEHTVNLCRACIALLPHYPDINKDLALSGVIVHDIGKTKEYTHHKQGLATTRSRIGILQGHVVLGYRIVRKAAIQCELSPELIERLEHIVLSHQGELEWGAACMASTPEAVFVSMLDNLDAKLGMVQQAIRTSLPNQEFSEYLPGLKSALLLHLNPKS